MCIFLPFLQAPVFCKFHDGQQPGDPDLQVCVKN